MRNATWILAAGLLTSPAEAADALRLEMGAPLVNMMASSGSFASFEVDASNKQLTWLFQCEESATITSLGFRYTLRTGTPPTYRISLQGLDSSGNPDGTAKGGGSPASATFTPPASNAWDGTTQAITLSNSYTCTRGEFLAEVIDYSSGTVSAAHKSSFTYAYTGLSNGRQSFPLAASFSGSSWGKSGDCPVYFYSSSDSTYGIPLRSLAQTARSSGAESAMFFRLPTGTVSTYQVRGIRAIINTPAAGKIIKVVLYDGTTALQSATVDSDSLSLGVTTQKAVSITFPDTTLATLTAGTTYRIGISPQDASNNVALNVLSLHDAQALGAFPGGTSWGYSTRTGCGAPCDTTATSWSDDTTARPLISLILSDMTTSSSAAGTSSHIFIK